MMKAMLTIEGIRTYAFHGCMEEEGMAGCFFVTDVSSELDAERSAATDNLADTADYGMVVETVKREMAVRSHLIEHVAGRIAAALKKAMPEIGKGTVKVSKLNPPLHVELDRVSITLHF